MAREGCLDSKGKEKLVVWMFCFLVRRSCDDSSPSSGASNKWKNSRVHWWRNLTNARCIAFPFSSRRFGSLGERPCPSTLPCSPTNLPFYTHRLSFPPDNCIRFEPRLVRKGCPYGLFPSSSEEVDLLKGFDVGSVRSGQAESPPSTGTLDDVRVDRTSRAQTRALLC